MKWYRMGTAALAALFLSTAGAHAVSDTYLAAFVQATDNPAPRVHAVTAEIKKSRHIDHIAKDGFIETPYDCLPELRPLCYDALIGLSRGQISENDGSMDFDWGEPFEAYEGDVEGQKDFVQRLIDEAAERGFNLLTNAELHAIVKDD